LVVRFGGCWVGLVTFIYGAHCIIIGAQERIAVAIIACNCNYCGRDPRCRAAATQESARPLRLQPTLPAALYTNYATSPKHTPRSAPPPRRFIKTQMGPGHIPRLCSFLLLLLRSRLYLWSSSHSHRSRTCTAYPTYSHVRPRVAMCKQRTLRTCSLCALLVLARTCPMQPLPHVLCRCLPMRMGGLILPPSVARASSDLGDEVVLLSGPGPGLGG